jgi:hypothetical protein
VRRSGESVVGRTTSLPFRFHSLKPPASETTFWYPSSTSDFAPKAERSPLAQ